MRRRLAWLLLPLAPVACDGGDDVVARGWIEGREVAVAPMTGGRLLSVLVEEGELVRRGDTVAVLTRGATTAEAGAARARAEAAAARLRELERGARPEDIGAARAELQGAEAELARARAELERLESLDSLDFVAEQRMDDARAVALRAASRRDVAREALTRLQRGARPEQVEAARAELDAARAALAAAESVAGELVLTSPVSGPVLVRVFEPGEVVGAGAPVITVLAGDERWVRVWLPQVALGAVRVGTRARLSIDPLPDTTFSGTVTSIASRAEFTPRVALTEDERADLMYAVRLRVDDPGGRLHVGLPVEARFGEADAD
ncbi:MAG TPA: HlyD family efflux transporter periplasmic adaptor subunit [Longimicrobiales bacterium]|nr:HlyD family efflux transporter periplasmic adaptor subunit [Longimicrobiales bacterium]